MTADDVFKPIASVVGLILTAVMGWLGKTVVANRDENIKHSEELKALEKRLDGVESRQLTKEDIRQVISEALSDRDRHLVDRRKQFDDLLALRIREAVMGGVHECQAQTKEEIKTMLPLMVKEIMQQTRRQPRLED